MPSDALSVVVCDAGPIIHLDELRSLDLLRAFEEILVPYPVWEEVQRHRPSALRRRKILLKRVDDMPEPTSELLRLFQTFAIDAGEAAAFKLLQQFPTAT